jgi:hypothetical protein
MAESAVLEYIETGSKLNHCRYLKAKFLTDPISKLVNQTMQESISKKSIFFTHKSSYIDISYYVKINITEKSNK